MPLFDKVKSRTRNKGCRNVLSGVEKVMDDPAELWEEKMKPVEIPPRR